MSQQNTPQRFELAPSNGRYMPLSDIHEGNELHIQRTGQHNSDDYIAALRSSHHDQNNLVVPNDRLDRPCPIDPLLRTPPATLRRPNPGAAPSEADHFCTPSRAQVRHLGRLPAAATLRTGLAIPFQDDHSKDSTPANTPPPDKIPSGSTFTVHTVRDGQIDNNFPFSWSGEFQTAEEAANYLSTLDEELQLPDLVSDDALFIQTYSMQPLAQKAMKAITHSFGPGPKDWDDKKRCYYKKQQESTMAKIVDFLSTPEGRRTAEARVFLAIQEGVNAHLIGMPASHFGNRKRSDRSSYKSDVRMVCSARLEAMRFAIEQNKLIAWDVLNGNGLADFARNPAQYLERKFINLKSNGNKKEGQQLFDKLKKESVSKPEAEDVEQLCRDEQEPNTSTCATMLPPAEDQAFMNGEEYHTQDVMAQQRPTSAALAQHTTSRQNGKKRRISTAEGSAPPSKISRGNRQQH